MIKNLMSRHMEMSEVPNILVDIWFIN